MRVVRGEHHPVRHLGKLDRLHKVPRIVWLLLLAVLSEEDQEAVLQGNASEFFDIPVPTPS